MDYSLETLQLFENTLLQFLENIQNVLTSKKKFQDFDTDVKSGKIKMTEFVENFNKSIKKYETRFLDKDLNVLSRINNLFFAQTKLCKVVNKLSDPQNMWAFLHLLYLYSELYINPERKDLDKLISICKPVNDGEQEEEESKGLLGLLNTVISGGSGEDAEDGCETIDLETLKSSLKQSCDIVLELFPGDDRIKKILDTATKELEKQIIENGGKINTKDLLSNVANLIKGKKINDKIAGIDFKKIIEKLGPVSKGPVINLSREEIQVKVKEMFQKLVNK